ncbi:MAG: pyrroline-5-carboxylate reductase [Luteibaculaceae bacterium]
MGNPTISVLGAGSLGCAIIKGLIHSGFSNPEHIIATRRNTQFLSAIANLGVRVTENNCVAVSETEIIILALKPYNIVPVLQQIKADLNPKKHLIISVATSISIAEIEHEIGTGFSIFRAMPNTAVEVKESVTCIAHKNANVAQVDTVKSIFSALGSTLVIDENLMESATILGACGIAYVLRFMRAMVQGGIQIGFSAKTASEIVNQTVLGASKLLIENGLHPEQEIDKVTTPRGCTIEGLNEMEHNGFSSSLIKGVVASYKKIEK